MNKLEEMTSMDEQESKSHKEEENGFDRYLEAMSVLANKNMAELELQAVDLLHKQAWKLYNEQNLQKSRSPHSVTFNVLVEVQRYRYKNFHQLRTCRSPPKKKRKVKKKETFHNLSFIKDTDGCYDIVTNETFTWDSSDEEVGKADSGWDSE